MGKKNLFDDIFGDFLGEYNDSYQNKDNTSFDIALRKHQYEERLDEMWQIIPYNSKQIVEYNKQVDMIKGTGYKILRNSYGKHKIVRRNQEKIYGML